MMLASGLAETIVSGPFVVAALIAVAAGAVSFASPCVIPLVPGYLSYLIGLVGAETSTTATAAHGGAVTGSAAHRTAAHRTATHRTGAQRTGAPESAATASVRSRAVRATLGFVLGFTVVFLAQTAAILGLAQALRVNLEVLTRIGGVVTIVMGLVMLGLIKPLQREWRLHARPTGRVLGAPLLGVVFGLGWVTCLGPTLTAVISLAISTEWNGNSWRGMFLVVFYCLGLGVPFLLLAFGFGWAGGALSFLRRHSRTVQIVGAAMLIVLGLLMVTGAWGSFISHLRTSVGDGGVLL